MGQYLLRTEAMVLPQLQPNPERLVLNEGTRNHPRGRYCCGRAF